MGGHNYRFKLSELIPNAWFYKLKDMGKSKSRKKQEQSQLNSTVSPPPIERHHSVPAPTTTTTARSPRLPPPPPPLRRSSHHSRPPQNQKGTSETPRKSRLRHRVTTVVDTNSSAAVCCRTNPPQLDFSTTSGDSTATGTGSFSPEFRSDQVLLPDESLESSWHSPCSYVSSKPSKAATFTPELSLRPVNTKPANKPTTVRKTSVNSPGTGVRLRLRSPRVSTRKSVSVSSSKRSGSGKTTTSARRSRAVVKASVDPRRDFKESMEEMIVENNIRTSKDLEELLACYLCLNSDEYHNIIINVFKQIWLDLNLPPQ